MFKAGKRNNPLFISLKCYISQYLSEVNEDKTEGGKERE